MADLGKVSSDGNIAIRITTFDPIEHDIPSTPSSLLFCAHTSLCLPFFFSFLSIHVFSANAFTFYKRANSEYITFAHLRLTVSLKFICEQRTKGYTITTTAHKAQDGSRSQLSPLVPTTSLPPYSRHGASTICSCQAAKHTLHHG
jgi:hypothetical protein